MGILSATAQSVEANPTDALTEILTSLEVKMENQSIDFILLFFTIGYDIDKLEQALKEKLKGIPHSGGSGEGLISNGFYQEEEKPSMVAIAFSGKSLEFEQNLFPSAASNEKSVGKQLFHWAKESKSKGVFLFPDGITCQTKILIEALNEEKSFFDKHIPFFGGCTGDALKLQKSYQLQNGKIYSGSVCAISIKGPVKFDYQISHGCTPISNEHTITQVDGNTILRIDDRPALEVLGQYQSAKEKENWMQTTMHLSLAFKMPKIDEHFFGEYQIRFFQNSDDGLGSFDLSISPNEGDIIKISRRDLDKIDQGVIHLGDDLEARTKGKKVYAIFQFDCAGRGKMIVPEEKTRRNLNFLQNGLGQAQSIPWFGFYTFGEIAPLGKENNFHNQTAIVLCLTKD